MCQQLPVDIGISTAQSVWSSRGAGLGPLIGAFVHVKVSIRSNDNQLITQEFNNNINVLCNAAKMD